MESILGLYTGFFELLGLSSPWKRFLFGSIAGFGGQLLIKPSISYRKDGTAKDLGETLFPWYAWAVVPASVFALFF